MDEGIIGIPVGPLKVTINTIATNLTDSRWMENPRHDAQAGQGCGLNRYWASDPYIPDALQDLKFLKLPPPAVSTSRSTLNKRRSSAGAGIHPPTIAE